MFFPLQITEKSFFGRSVQIELSWWGISYRTIFWKIPISYRAQIIHLFQSRVNFHIYWIFTYWAENLTFTSFCWKIIGNNQPKRVQRHKVVLKLSGANWSVYVSRYKNKQTNNPRQLFSHVRENSCDENSLGENWSGESRGPFFKIPSAFTLPSNPTPSVSIFPIHTFNNKNCTRPITIWITITISTSISAFTLLLIGISEREVFSSEAQNSVDIQGVFFSLGLP